MLKERIKQSAVYPLAAEVRALLTPQARRLAEDVRAATNTMTAALGRPTRLEESLRHQWHRILSQSEEVPNGKGRGQGTRVLLASGYGFSPTKLAIESIFASALRLRGALVQVLACDASLSACEFNRFGNFEPAPGEFGPPLGPRARLSTCHTCKSGIEEVFAPLGIPILRLGRYAEPGDLERLEALLSDVPFADFRQVVYKGIRVGDHAFSSSLRTTLRGTLIEDEPTRWLFRRYLLAGMHLVDQFERLIAAERPDRVVAIHGVYLVHGTICEVARKHGIPVSVFGVPYRQGTIWLSHDDSYHRTLVTEPTALWEGLRLSPEQDRRLDEYLESKRGGGRDYVNYHPNPLEDRERIISELGLDPERPVVSLFTNVIWDAQIYYDFNAFENILEWVFETIEYFGRRPEVQLVIRVHPAEVKGGMPTNQPIAHEIARRFPTLPENVRLIQPESDVSSYTLAEMSSAALIYGTKMGLEIALRGIPVVVAGETFNRGKGFTHDISTKAEYFELLGRVERLPRNSPETIQRARRYAYYLFFQRMIDFPLLHVDEPHSSRGLRLTFDRVSRLAPGADSALDLVCSGILHGTPFVQRDPQSLDPSGPPAEGVWEKPVPTKLDLRAG